MKRDEDSLGARMKAYEGLETSRCIMPRLPALIRIDGRCFSKWTKGLGRPYDERMVRAMIETTKFLVDETKAVIGYTQSDEITLVFSPRNIFFDGKIFKMESNAASLAAVKFNSLVPGLIPEKREKLASFDARAWGTPSLDEAVNALIWRELDATKNSISMAARSCFSHKSLHGLNGGQMQERLYQERGINWNDYPSFFKRGTYVQRRRKNVVLSQEELARIPEKYRPEGPVERWKIEELEVPPLCRLANRVGFVFEGEDPVLIQEDAPAV